MPGVPPVPAASLPTLEAEAVLAVELRLGTLVPEQVLDGPGLHLAAGLGVALGSGFWLRFESGVDHCGVEGLATRLATAQGGVDLWADHEQWSVPFLAGVGYTEGRGEGARLGFTLLGGMAYDHARLATGVSSGPKLSEDSSDSFDPLIVGRAELGWYMGPGLLVLGGAWRQVFLVGERSTGDIRPGGLVLEAGWRQLF